MTTVNAVFDNADLSLAAYADLVSGVRTDSQIQKLTNAGMTEEQAKRE